MEKNVTPPIKKDDSMTGFMIIGAVLILLVGFIILLSTQQKQETCTPVYAPDGSVITGCDDPLDSTLSPTPETSVDLLDQLNQGQVSEVDKQLQEAADDFMNQQKSRQQPPQQQQIPAIPQN